MTTQECIEWAQDPIQECAGQPIIPASNFDSLAVSLANQSDIDKTAEEILDIFREQSKRFTACGANLADRFAVLRKNKENGWQYLIDLLN